MINWMFIKRTQISLYATILLSFSVAVLTLLANKEIDNRLDKQDATHIDSSHKINTTQVAGGSATGNAINPLALNGNYQGATQDLPLNSNQRDSLGFGKAVTTSKTSLFDFEHLFIGEKVPQNFHYKGQYPSSLDLVISSDSIQADSLLLLIGKLQDSIQDSTQKKSISPLKIGSLTPYSITIRGKLQLKELSNIHLFGFNSNSPVEILNSHNLLLQGFEVSSSADPGIRIENSTRINLREIYLHHNQVGLQIDDSDQSLATLEQAIELDRSILTHNQIGMGLRNSHSVQIKNNFIAHNTQSFEVLQEKPVLMSITGAIQGSRNIFYQSPNGSNSYLNNDFWDTNLSEDNFQKKNMNSIAWFWMAH